ncbi:MAG TPA: catalase [Blastocatellia bacterium]|nr:catalase [Blastocatellia bacterium]
MANGTGWKEDYLNEEGKKGNGSKDKEKEYFKELSQQIKEVVRHFAVDNGRPMRGNHAKNLAGFTGAEFRISSDLSTDLSVGFLIPNKVYEAIIRFSNASSEVRSDDAKSDLRGVAIRVKTDLGDHDFLMTNANKHHARDAREAMVTIMAGTLKDTAEDLTPGAGIIDKAVGGIAFYGYLLTHLDKETADRIKDTLKEQTAREVKSLATETYFSRAPIAIGNVTDPEQSVAVKYRLEPVGDKSEQFGESNNLGQEIKNRLNQKDVRFLFQVQRYIDSQTTPIEDSTVIWPDEWETIAELIIPRRTQTNNEFVDGLAFSPWKTDLTNFRPIGSMNRSRKTVYEASASLENRPVQPS